MHRTGQQAGDLSRTGARLASEPPKAERALDSLDACLEALRGAAGGVDAAMGEEERRADAHRVAAAAAATAGDTTRDREAQASLNLAAQQRRAAERQTAAAQQAAADRAAACAQLDLQAAVLRVNEVSLWSRAVAGLPEQARHARDALARVLLDARRLADGAAGPAGPGGRAGQRDAEVRQAHARLTAQLAPALPPGPAARPPAARPADATVFPGAVQPHEASAALDRWGRAHSLRFFRWQRLAIVDDAALFVRVAGRDPACRADCLAQDLTEQARERGDLLAEAEQRRRERDAAGAALAGLQSRWRSAVNAAGQRVAAGDGGVTGEVRRWAEASQARAEALEAALVDRCTAELQGTPDQRLCAARGYQREDAQAAGPPAPVSAVLSEVRLHAYTWINRWDLEPRGFGAYTYVLLPGSLSRQSPDVRHRLSRLLAELETLPEAATITGEQRAKTNLFILPGLGADPPHQGYDTQLAQALMARSQGAILLQPGVRGRLVENPGPFLITLPVRIAEADGSTPLLLADLSQAPPDAITDLARSYMRGLVDRFPTEQENWRPPTGQVVALWMLRVAASTGQLIETVMPTAAARPAR